MKTCGNCGCKTLTAEFEANMGACELCCKTYLAQRDRRYSLKDIADIKHYFITDDDGKEKRVKKSVYKAYNGIRREEIVSYGRLVDSIVNHMETLPSNEDGESLLADWDCIEIADVAEDYPSLKKHIGRRLDPTEKARLVITAAGYYWFKRGENLLANIVMPLQNYPELSVSVEMIAMDIRTVIKVKVISYRLLIPAAGRDYMEVSKRTFGNIYKQNPAICRKIEKYQLMEV